MNELDLSSLEKSVVESAQTATVQPVTTEPTITEDPPVIPKSEAPPVVTIEEEDPTVPPTKEEIEAAITGIENIEEAAKEPEVEDKDEELKIYAGLGEFLKAKEIINGEFEVNSEDSLVKAISKTIEESKYSGLTDSQKLYLDAIESGIPDTTAKTIVADIAQLSKVDEAMLEENQTLAEELLTGDLTSQGWEEAAIAKQIERLKKTDELVSEGLLSKNRLIKNNIDAVEQSKAANLKAARDAEIKLDKQMEELKSSVYEEGTALGTIKVDDSLRNQVFQSMTKPVAYAEDGKPLNAMMKDKLDNPVDFEKRLGYVYVLTNGFKDMSRLQRRADSSAARKLKDAVQGLNMDLLGQGASVPVADKSVPNIVSV